MLFSDSATGPVLRDYFLRIGANVGAISILAAVALTLVGNRWASYIVTPVPGLYLVDALFVVGSLLGLGEIKYLNFFPRWILWLLVAVWGYSLFMLIPEIITTDSDSRYDALRDAAPYFYLSIAPFAALALIIALTLR